LHAEDFVWMSGKKKGERRKKSGKQAEAAALYLDFPKAQPPIGSAPPISHLLTYQLAAQLAAICFQLLNKCGGGGGVYFPWHFRCVASAN